MSIEDQEIADQTNKFVQFLLNSRQYNDFAPTIAILGNKGGGKTGQAFINLTLILAGDLKPHLIDKGEYYRNVALFKAPETLIDEIKKSFPPELSSRFRIINDIYDVKPFEILYIDEAGLVFDGKLALKKENREAMGGFTYARHNRIPVIYSTVKPKVLTDLRVMTEIFIYKRLSKRFIRELIKEGDQFVRDYQDILGKLRVDRSLIDADYKYLTCSGGLKMHKDKFCPFFTEAISTNMRGQNLANERTKSLELKKSMEPIIQEIIQKYGPELKKGHASKLVRGWLLNEKPFIAETFKDHVNDIVARAFQIFHDQYQENEIKIIKTNKITVPDLIEVDETNSGFFKFLEDFYLENLPSVLKLNNKSKFKKEHLVQILRQWSEGIGIRDINVSLERGKTIPQMMVQKILKIFNNGEGIIQNDLRLFSCYEHWIAYRTGGEVLSGISNPDIMFKIGGAEYPGECKLYNNVQKNIALDKRVLLSPSLRYCQKNNITYFPVFFRNTKWGDVDYVYRVETDGNNIVNFEPLDENILRNFKIDQFYNIKNVKFTKNQINKMAKTIKKDLEDDQS